MVVSIVGLIFVGPSIINQVEKTDGDYISHEFLKEVEVVFDLPGELPVLERSNFDRIVARVTGANKTKVTIDDDGELITENGLNFNDLLAYFIYSTDRTPIVNGGALALKELEPYLYVLNFNRVISSGEAQDFSTEDKSGNQLRAVMLPLINNNEVKAVAVVELRKTNAAVLVASTFRAASMIAGTTIAIAFTILIIVQSQSLRGKLKAERQARKLLQYDRLTGLLNRKSFEEKAGRLPKNVSYALGIIDVDDFKLFNDKHGHLAGDEVLAHVAKCLKDQFPEATLCRWAGDEFIFILPNVVTDIELTQHLVDLTDKITEPIQHNQVLMYCSATIGGSVGSLQDQSLDEFIKHSDAAMYEAKAMVGKGHYAVYTPEMDKKQRRKIEISERLEHAIEKDDFHLVFQPQYDAKAKKLEGFEALLRWEDEVLGNVSPGEFIPIAESSGHIIAIGEWVLRQACMQAAQWPDDYNISVNVSAVQFEREQFMDLLRSALYKSKLDPTRLELELTETALLGKGEVVASRLEEVHAMGVSIAMDDFGTGHSTLTYLATLPVSKIKIDRSFVSKVGDKGRNDAIINAMVGLAHRMDLEVIAEGVETHEQSALIQAMGCSNIQGFLYGKPTKDPFGDTSSVRGLMKKARRAFEVAS